MDTTRMLDSKLLKDLSELEEAEELVSSANFAHPNTGKIIEHGDGTKYRVRRDGAWIRITDKY